MLIAQEKKEKQRQDAAEAEAKAAKEAEAAAANPAQPNAAAPSDAAPATDAPVRIWPFTHHCLVHSMRCLMYHDAPSLPLCPILKICLRL